MIDIRLAEPGEAGALLELWQAAGSSPSNTDNIESVTAAIEWVGTWVLVAESAGVIVGSLIATWDGWRGNMYRLAVRPEHQRRGIATALLDEGERLLRERGARRVSAVVLFEEPPAVAFWEQAGYALQPEARRFTKVV